MNRFLARRSCALALPLPVLQLLTLPFLVLPLLAASCVGGPPQIQEPDPTPPAPDVQCDEPLADVVVSGTVQGPIFAVFAGEPVSIVFVNEESGEAFYESVTSTRDFSATIPAGTYTATMNIFARNYTDLDDDKRVLASGLELLSDTENLDFVLEAEARTIDVTFAGGAFPDVGPDASRGEIILRGRNHREIFRRDVPADGAPLSIPFFSDNEYDVEWSHVDSLWGEDVPQIADQVLPFGRIQIGTLSTTSPDETLNFDVPNDFVVVDLDVTVNGQAFTDEVIDATRGSVRIYDAIAIDVGATGPVTYAVKLVPNQYAVAFEALYFDVPGVFHWTARVPLCRDLPRGSVGNPGSEQSALQACDFNADATLAFDVNAQSYPVGDVTATLSWTSTDGVERRFTDGAVDFWDETSRVSIRGEVNANGGIVVRDMPAGTYQVTFVNGRVDSGPLGKLELESTLVVTAAGLERNWNVPAIEAKVEILRNGVTAPDNGVADPETRGFLTFTAVDAESPFAFAARVDLGITGPATADVYLVPGDYSLRLSSYTGVGHGTVRVDRQDVFPSGDKELGEFSFETTGGPLGVNVDVVRVVETIADFEDGQSVAFVRGDGVPSWVPTSETVELLLYTGRHDVFVVQSPPDYFAGQWGTYENPLRTICVEVNPS